MNKKAIVKPNLYVLLIGINDYPDDELYGCLNDVQLINEHLNERFSSRYQLHSKKLLNKKASYRNVIETFRNHLGQAGNGDFVYFHFSGHGCRQPSAQEFLTIDHSGKDEVLCTYDIDDIGYGLADKEIAVLLSELDRQGVHSTVVFDCCHSGSATRGLFDEPLFTSGRRFRSKSRIGDLLRQPRPIDSYIDNFYGRQLKQNQPVVIPESRHLLLSACNKRQVAWEVEKPGFWGDNTYGALTWCLVEVLEKSKEALSYKRLHHLVKAAVSRQAERAQWPQLESHGKFNPEWSFLGDRTVGKQRRFRLSYNAARDYWRLNAGIMNGIEAGMRIAIIGADDQSVIHEAPVDSTRFGFSLLFGPLPLSTGEEYRVRILDRPQNPISVYIDGDREEIVKWQQFVEAEEFFLIDQVDLQQQAQFDLNFVGGGFYLRDLSAGKEIGRSTYHRNLYRQLRAVLGQLYQWHSIANLENDRSSITSNDLEVIFEWQAGGQWFSENDGLSAIDIIEKDGEQLAVPYRISVRNNSGKRLSMLFLYLNQQFFYTHLLHAAEILPGREIVVCKGLKMSLDEGFNSQQEHFKLIAAEENVDLDPGQFSLAPIKTAFEAFRITRGDRAIGLEEPPVSPQVAVPRHLRWQAKSLMVDISRKTSEISRDEIRLPGNIIIAGHPEFRASVALGNTHASRHRTVADAVRPLPGHLDLMTLQHTRDINGQANSIDLSSMEGVSGVNPDQPLNITIPPQTTADTIVIPIAGASGIWFAVPYRQQVSQGLQFDIEGLPEGAGERGARSLRGALKLAFLKLVLKKPDINQFRRAIFPDHGEVVYLENDLPQAVGRAENIYLILHGIIGDSAPQALGVARALARAGYGLRPEKDLVLAYDFENLNTGIAKSAADLYRHLKRVGLQESGKKITVIAHSMGGLIARWLIEHPDFRDDQPINRLITIGTPHKGSKWGTLVQYRNLLTAALSFSLNSFHGDIPVLSWMIKALEGTELLTETLAEMQPQSLILQQLAAFDDPGIPYALIGGDAWAAGYPDRELHERIFLGMAEAGSEFLYGDQPNDLAVTIDSAHGISDRRSPAPQRLTVASSHLDYYRNPASLRVLGGLLER